MGSAVCVPDTKYSVDFSNFISGGIINIISYKCYFYLMRGYWFQWHITFPPGNQ